MVHASENIADLKRLADAWQPLYQTLTLDHKWRKAALTIVALRDVASGIEQAPHDGLLSRGLRNGCKPNGPRRRVNSRRAVE